MRMIKFEKTVNDITQVHSEFKIVLGGNNDIMKSMQKFLHSKHDTITGTVLTETNTICNPTTDNISTEILYDTNNCRLHEYENFQDALYHPNDIELCFSDYKEMVEWALWVCKNNIPSPFNIGYPATCYQLSLNHDSFVIDFPNSIGLGVKVFSSNNKSIAYTINLIFYVIPYSKEVFIEETDLYKNAVKWNWYIRS